MPREKRKAHQLDAEKRQRLTWNMYDATAEVANEIPSTSDGTPLSIASQPVNYGTSQDQAASTVIEDVAEDTSMSIQQSSTSSICLEASDKPLNLDDAPHPSLSHVPTSPNQSPHPYIVTSDKLAPHDEARHPTLSHHNVVDTTTSLLNHHITSREYQAIWDSSKYSIQVHNSVAKEEIACRLGNITFTVSGYSRFDPKAQQKPGNDVPSLPRYLPEGNFSIFASRPSTEPINTTPSTLVIYDVLDGNQENFFRRSSNTKAMSYLCLEATYVESNHLAQFDALECMCRVKKGKVLKLLMKEYRRLEEATAILTVSVCLLNGGLCTPQFAAESNISRSQQVVNMITLMNWMEGFPIPDSSYIRPAERQKDFNQLFDCLREAHSRWYNIQESWDVQHPSLNPKLRPYQIQAVKWMTDKENCNAGLETSGNTEEEQQRDSLHMLWRRMSDSCGGDPVYYNPESGQFTRHRFLAPVRIPGGILADEMGLGKTVEVLACILKHTRPGFNHEYTKDKGYKTSTTLAASHVTSPDESLANANAHRKSEKTVTVISRTEIQSDGSDVETDRSTVPASSAESENKTEDLSSGETQMNAEPSTSSANESKDLPSEETQKCNRPPSTLMSLTRSSPGESAISTTEKETKNTTLSMVTTVCEKRLDDQMPSENDNKLSIVSMDSRGNGQSGESSRLSPNAALERKDVEMTEKYSEENIRCEETQDMLKCADGSFVKIENDAILHHVSPGEKKEKKKKNKKRKNVGCEKTADLSNCVVSLVKMEVDAISHSVVSMEKDDVDIGCEMTQDMLNSSDETNVVKHEDILSGERTINDSDMSTVRVHAVTACLNPSTNTEATGRVDRSQSPKMDNTPTTEVQLKRERSPKACVSNNTVSSGESLPHVADLSPVPPKSEHSPLICNVNDAIPSGGSTSNKASVDIKVTSEPSPLIGNTDDTIPSGGSSTSIKDSTEAEVKSEPSPLICVSKGQFQCICGKQEVWVDPSKCVKCTKCLVWQHMMCVNFDPDRGDVSLYLCPHCCIALKPVSSRGTLIVSPTAICHQWVDEINRHINNASLRVLVYKGVKKHGFLQPRALANHDIVITTYDTLRTELNYVDLHHTASNSGRRLRHAKRYMSIPSPLPAVDWWRVCLDEAQMVECPTAKVAEMALRLTACNRWCVTGTPIQRDLSDLYGLFLFLGVEPYWVRQWWDQMLYKPYCRGNQQPMKDVLAEVLWRSAKKDVLNQIDIPPQTEKIHWLKFSAVEEHFYKRKHEDCSQHFRYVVNRLQVEQDVTLSKLDKDSVKRLLSPFLRLRQACCHPQAVRGEFLPLQKNTMTMEELLKSLTAKTQTECEEAHRQLVCALNGQAAVHLMKDEIVEAVSKYREVLLSAEEQKEKLKTDSLQRLHAMHNLWELLETQPDGVAPTLRDDKLQDHMKEIRDAYMAKAEAIVASSLQSLEPIQRKMIELNRDYDPDAAWWLDGLIWARHQGYDEELVLRVKNELSSGTAHNDNMNFSNRFRDVRGLQFVLGQHLDALQESRETVSSKLEELNVPIDRTTLAQCVDCHLRPSQGKKKNNCAYCQLDRLLVQYEMRLFSFNQRDIVDLYRTTNNEDATYGLNRPRGTWASSQTERALRVIQVFLRQVGSDELLLEFADIHIQLLEQQKKEFKGLRAMWMALRDRVAAMDELEMATMRLRLKDPDEEIDKASQPYIIEPHELDQQRQKLLNDQAVAKYDLRRKFGQLMYLQNLAKAGEGSLNAGVNPEPCPICDNDLGTSWTVLTCGHCFCQDCMDVLIERHSFGARKVRCAICRSQTATKEISYVTTRKQEPEDIGINIKGGYSTKVEAIVKALIRIRQDDPTAKSIVFSTWVDVLEIIGRALRDNAIDYRSITHPGHKMFQSNLTDFKHEASISALLIPVHTGSHGLNLIEATHVLLVEPILNPASELQAVGRVHRIGQTRPTVVHRFLVRTTIEERLQALLTAHPISASLDTVVESETGDLTLGDLEKLFVQTDYCVRSGSDDDTD